MGSSEEPGRSLERLYVHADDVYRYTLAMLGESGAAEDATQATFAGAQRALTAGERPAADDRRWLTTLAHHVCREHSGPPAGEGPPEDLPPFFDVFLGCDQAERAISLSGDRELPPHAVAGLARHLRDCDRCVRASEYLYLVRGAFGALSELPAPESLRVRLESLVQ